MSRRPTLLMLLLVSSIVGAAWLMMCTAETHEDWIVGAILSETGPADFIGKPEADVLRALKDQYEQLGQWPEDIRLEVRNSEGKPERAVSLFERFSETDQVLAVIGPSTSGESIAVARIAEEKQVPLLSLAASKKILYSTEGRLLRWVFKFAQNDDLAAEKLVSTMIGDGRKNVALLYSDDGFGKSGAEVFRQKVEESELILAHDVSFPPSLSTAEPFVASLPDDVDAIMIWGTAPGPALIVKAIRSLGLTTAIYLSHGNASKEFLRSAGSAVEGATVVGSHVLKTSEHLNKSNPRDVVLQRYRNFWGKSLQGPPSHFGGHARDALEALVYSIERSDLSLPTPEVREHIRDALEKLSQFEGVTGSFNFSAEDHAGLTSDAFEVYTVRSGEFIPREARRSK